MIETDEEEEEPGSEQDDEEEEFRSEDSEEDDDDEKKLWSAARRGDTYRVQQLLAEGVNPNAAVGFMQTTPLHEAAKNDHHETVSVLLTAGADVNARDKYKNTPLHQAALNGTHETMSVLLTAGADVNIRNKSQWTPLYYAAQDGHHEAVSVLLTAGAAVNARDQQQLTPLHHAAWVGHHETVSVLLTAGADVNARDDRQRTSLHWAALSGHHEPVLVLLTAGADVNARDRTENTPLHDAATVGRPKCAEVLLQHGADTAIRNRIGKTAEDIAADENIDHNLFTPPSKDKKERIIPGRKEILKLLRQETNEVSARKKYDPVLVRFYEERGMTVVKKDCPLIEAAAKESGKTVQQVNNFIDNYRKSKGDGKRRSTTGNMAAGKSAITGHSSVPLEIQLRGPRMQQLYAKACRQGARLLHIARGLVVGQFRSGKTCVVRRLMGEKAVEDEPITDGIEISPSVMTKTWRKAEEEPDEFKETMAERLAEQQEMSKSTTLTSSRTQSQEAVKQKSDLRKKTTESGGVASTQAIPADTVMKAQQRLLGDVTVLQQTQDIPDDVITKVQQRLQGYVTEEQLGTAEYPRLSLWDFGGQATYYGSHQCFFTYRGIYILVMSLLQKLSDTVPDLDYKASADNLVTGRDYLDHWLNSVHTHTLVHGRDQKEPPVLFVLTHKKEVSESDIETYKKYILDHISGKAASKHVLPKIFTVDNFDEDNSDFDELREYLREVAKGLSYMGEEVPMTWLHLKSKLMDKRKEDDPFCRFQDVVDLARSDDVGITDDSHVPGILTFLHDLGDIIFINEPVLRDHVALRPQVMIDVFKTIITVPQYQQDRSTDEVVAKMWERLENEGILSGRLLTIIWTKADQKMQKPFLLKNKSFLKRLMEKYYLLCNATPIDGLDDTMYEAEREEIYFVPSLLATKPNDLTLYPGHMRRCRYPLYVVFDNMFLPSGMFYRLQAICVRRFGLEESRVFAGCGRFPTDDVKQQFVVTKVRHYLKMELLSADAEEQPVFTEGLRVRKFLSSCLFEIKEKWIPSIQYDWCHGEESDENNGDPVFHLLSVIGQETATGSKNSGGAGPVMIEPTLSPDDVSAVRTIGPVLDCMETCGGLSLTECDRIRHELTYVSRFKELVATVNRDGETCRRLLGASVEVCLPERASMFLREERGDEIVFLHVGDYNDKLVQPLLKQADKSSTRYGVTVSEDVIKPGDVITDKLLDHLLTRNVRMVVPIITPQALHSRYWSALGYEFSVQNKDLVFPVFAYPEGTKDRLLEVLGKRCAGMLDRPSTEVPMTEEPLSSIRISFTATEILRKASLSIVLYTCKITPEGCTVDEDGVTITFPKGCVKTERFLSLEVDMLPIDDAMTNSFSAVTPVLTVHQDTEEDFLLPVTVTLPWAWKSACDLGRTILMNRSSGSKWSTLRTEVQETEDTVTFTMLHFCSVTGAKKKDSTGNASSSADTSVDKQDEEADQEATEDIEVLVTKYSEDKVHLIISPNEATTDDKRIHLLCIEKGKKVTEYFRADNFQTPAPFRQEIIMHKKEAIRARFGEEEDVVGDPRDIPEPPGIQFVFPPANCNRISVRLKLRDPLIGKGKFEGTVHFTLLSEAGEPVREPIRRINSAHVYLHSLQAGNRQSSHPSGSSILAMETLRAITSVLMVSDAYGTSQGGTSTVNRQVAQFLKHHGATVHSTALKASEEDKRCAEEDGVILHLPVQTARDKRTPSLEWLTEYHSIHYPYIPQDLDYIMGHVDVTSGAAKSIQENRCQHAKLVLFNHDMPEATEHYKGAEKAMAAWKKVGDILEDTKNADAVFSLGRKIYEHFETKYKSLGENKPRKHLMFLPRPSAAFESISVKPGGGQKTVLTVGRVTEVERLKGHDLAARAMGEIAEKIPNVTLRVRGIDEDDWEASKKILEENLQSDRIKPTLLPCGTQEDIAQDMQQAHLVLMPSRAEPFGMIGLEAIAAGIPVLISDKSGLADMIKDLIDKEKCHPDMRHRIMKTSVNESDLGVNSKLWAEKIVDTLKFSKSEFKMAAEFKKELLESKYWEESHQNLLRVCGLMD
ncbi:ANKRD28 [Branchiostoma lanceolatum]|uniref:ANKRD28 protein n=1 Tax=Branchiostoma lanceolatum TaxID=7740 RepID=A0A8K0A2S2_BRALA|nr:ANKRD28 [Branchiostoma lanceolatum]